MSEPAAPARRAAQPPGSDGRAGVAAAVLYLDDEVAAAGWRLAGVHTLVPAPGQEAAALEEALAGARARAAAAGPAAPAHAAPAATLVLLSAALAARLDNERLQAALAALQPLVVVVPDTQGEVAVPALAARVAAQLGLDAGALAEAKR